MKLQINSKLEELVLMTKDFRYCKTKPYQTLMKEHKSLSDEENNQNLKCYRTVLKILYEQAISSSKVKSKKDISDYLLEHSNVYCKTRDELIFSHLRYVRELISYNESRFCHTLELSEQINFALEHIYSSFHNYNPEFAFSTWLSSQFSTKLLNYVDLESENTTSKHYVDLKKKVFGTLAKIESSDLPNDLETISTVSKIPTKTVFRVLSYSKVVKPFSLEPVTGDDNLGLIELVPSSGDSPYDSLIKKDTLNVLNSSLNKLTGIKKAVVFMRHGIPEGTLKSKFDFNEPLTVKDLSKEFNMGYKELWCVISKVQKDIKKELEEYA